MITQNHPTQNTSSWCSLPDTQQQHTYTGIGEYTDVEMIKEEIDAGTVRRVASLQHTVLPTTTPSAATRHHLLHNTVIRSYICADSRTAALRLEDRSGFKCLLFGGRQGQ